MFGKNKNTTFTSRTSSRINTGLGIETNGQNMTRESSVYKLYYDKCQQIYDATLEDDTVKQLYQLLNDCLNGKTSLSAIQSARTNFEAMRDNFINLSLHNQNNMTGSLISNANRIRKDNLVFAGFKAIGDILSAMDIETNMQTIKTYNTILTNSVEWDVALRSDEVTKKL